MKKDGKYKMLVIVSTIFAVAYFIWRIFFTMPTTYGMAAMICAVIFLVCELVSALEAFIHIHLSVDPYVPELPDIPKDWYPEVDVFIATHNESTEILYKTINGCKHMHYPDKSKVHIWICDDGNRKEMKELAEKMNVGYQGLANNKHAKAGNLNNAISKTNAPLIVTFDSDMIPTRDFLMETVPYFFLPKMKKDSKGKWVVRKEDEIDKNFKIGFIQTPQSFYNPDLFQYNFYSEKRIPNEQDYFFKEINVSRNKSNSPIYAGSNTVISRKALLEVGGIATGTITEDFETGLHIQERGYSCYAIDKVLAHGLSPDTIDSLIKQRERWGRGCIYSLRKIKIFSNKNLSLDAKLSYFSCELYWWTFLRRFVFIVSPILFGVFSVPVLVCRPWQLLAIWLPYYYSMNKCQEKIAGDIRNQHWSDIVDTVMFPYLILPLIMEALGIKKRKFVVTRKDRSVETRSTALFAVPHIILFTFSLFSLFVSISDLLKYKAFGSIIIIFWICVNLISLFMAILFMIGRKNYRMNERFYVNIPVKIRNGEEYIFAQTCDISESSIAVILDSPVFVNNGENVDIQIKTDFYESKFKAEIVHIIKLEDEMKWKLSFKITEIDDYNKEEYFAMVYDREPSLSSKIDEDISIFDDLLINIINRSEIVERREEKRQSYRIPVNEYMKTNDGNQVYVADFNYKNIGLKDCKKHEHLTIQVAPSIELKCEYYKTIKESNKIIYKVLNSSEISINDKFDGILKGWINKNITEQDQREVKV